MPSQDVLSIFKQEDLTLEEVIKSLTIALRAMDSPVENPGREARLVVAEALHLAPLTLLQDLKKPLSHFSLQARERLQEFSKRRMQGEPLSRLRGWRSFWKSDFLISSATLDPRPETEGLIELACEFFSTRDHPRRIVDLGTGTGCLILSLLQEFPEAAGLGIDCSSEALEIAKRNARRLNLLERCQFTLGNWLEGQIGTFDLIVSNPPYIPSEDLRDLSLSVRDFDPLLALDGGKDGLEAYRFLIPQAARHLSSRGLFLLESGIHQHVPLESLLKTSFPKVSFVPDLAGIMRYGVATF